MSGKKLTFGFLYDFRNPPQWRRPWAELYAEQLDVIAWTESVGYTGAWVPEHHLADDGYIPAPHVVLAAIAARTKTLRLGTAVGLAPLHHPVRFAEDCAVLDILSNGRLEVALAIGYRRREAAAFGVDFTRRGARFDEFLDIVLRLWAGETVTYEGKHFSIEGAKIMPPAPRGRIPLYIGGFADKALARVAQHADGYFGNEESFAPYVEKLREMGKDTAGARILIPALTMAVARDPAAALEELAPHYLHINNSYGAWFHEDKALGMDGMTPTTLDEFKASGSLPVLTPDQAIAHFKAMQERIPVEHIMLTYPAGLPADRFVEYARLFAEEVIPAFQ